MRKAMHPLRQGLRLANAMCDAGRDGNFASGQGQRRAMHVSKCFVCFCFDSWERLTDKRWRPKTFDVIGLCLKHGVARCAAMIQP